MPAQVLGDLQELGVELLAVSGDPRERAESFVRLSTILLAFNDSLSTPAVMNSILKEIGVQAGQMAHTLQYVGGNPLECPDQS